MSSDDRNNACSYEREAYEALLAEDYSRAVKLYEQAISQYDLAAYGFDVNIRFNYWYLGTAYLLQGQEIEAQSVWMQLLLQDTEAEIEVWTDELVSILKSQATQLERLVKSDAERISKLQLAWLVRQHIREIYPLDLNNLLHILRLSLELKILDHDESLLNQIIELAQLAVEEDEVEVIDTELLISVAQQMLVTYPQHPLACELIASFSIMPRFTLAVYELLLQHMSTFMHELPRPVALPYVELCYKLQPKRLEVVVNLANLYQDVGKSAESIYFAQKICELSNNPLDLIASNYLLTRGFMKIGGQWQKAQAAYQAYTQTLRTLIQANNPIDISHIFNMSVVGAYAFYFNDDPRESHQFLAQLAQFCQSRIDNYFCQSSQPKLFNHTKANNNRKGKKLKIGYISECLRRHSVGWLSRWLFQYHNLEQFDIYAYSLIRTDDKLQKAIADCVSEFRHYSLANNPLEIATQIYKDGIDILVDLDSLTSNLTYAVMALKPTPIQITWLGFDASELPTVDYFIADSFVLPASAQEYYTAKIWQLPQTYIAVDGFEVGIPTLRREYLDIPADAVVYFSAQTIHKRHPDIIRLQFQILKAVPNSYFLIKGDGDPEAVKQFFEQIAKEEGVNCDRLRFLPGVSTEEEHRANLNIADVVLDTYPYNGATTTLETLWMGIPLVTRVGEQFAARNSYTMMMNAGITEGIAWTDTEYVDWGIRFGLEENLRRKVAWQLQQSQKSSPLWNAQAFTQNMEKAYTQMWHIYQAN